MLQRYKKKSQRHHAVTTFLRFFSRSHAACSSQSGNNRRCDTCNHLYDELNSFSLCHGIKCLMFRSALPLGSAKNVSCKAGGFRPARLISLAWNVARWLGLTAVT